MTLTKQEKRDAIEKLHDTWMISKLLRKRLIFTNWLDDVNTETIPSDIIRPS